MSFDASRGSLVWRFNRFKEDGLCRLLDDLQAKEARGLKNAECNEVKQALGQITNACSSIPDGGLLRKPILDIMQKFLDLYTEWNDKEGYNEEIIMKRMILLKKLRKCRQKLARKIRVNQHILDNNYDLQAIDSVFGAFDTLCTSCPGLFSNLSKAVERYYKRGGGNN